MVPTRHWRLHIVLTVLVACDQDESGTTCAMAGTSNITYTFDGTTGVEWTSSIEISTLGATAASLGDVDGDGLPELAISSASGGGGWYDELLYFPSTSSWTSGFWPGTFLIPGSASPQSLNLATRRDLWGAGGVLFAGGDLDGDGLADVLRLQTFGWADGWEDYRLLWSPGASDLGAVFSESAATTEEEWESLMDAAAISALGGTQPYRVIPVPDQDGDGRGELVAALWGDQRAAVLLNGADDPAQIEVVAAIRVDSAFGTAYDDSDEDDAPPAVGDLDGDGLMDLGLAESNTVETGAPVVRVMLGPVTSDLVATSDADLSVFDQTTDGRFGAALALRGDVNDDGYDDVLTSNPEAPETVAEGRTGAIYLFAGGAAPRSRGVGDADSRIDGAGFTRECDEDTTVSGCSIGGQVGYAGEMDREPGDEIWATSCSDNEVLIWRGAALLRGDLTPAADVTPVTFWGHPQGFGAEVARPEFTDANQDGRADMLVPAIRGSDPIGQGLGDGGATLLLAEDLMP